MKRKLKQWW